MAVKKSLFNIKGMVRDAAASKFTPEYAYENQNLRIIATDDNTSYGLTNEKGNVMYTKIFNVFFTALITSREIYNDFSYVDDKINKSNNK